VPGSCGCLAAMGGMRRAQVHVQRRETDRQREQRTSSYAYLAAREREEPWKPLQARRGRLRPPGDLACAGAANASDHAHLQKCILAARLPETCAACALPHQLLRTRPDAVLLAGWADAYHAGVHSHCMFARQGVFRKRRTAASLVVRRPAQVFRPGSAECRTALQVLQDAQHAGGQHFDLPRTEYKGVFARGEGGANPYYIKCGVCG